MANTFPRSSSSRECSILSDFQEPSILLLGAGSRSWSDGIFAGDAGFAKEVVLRQCNGTLGCSSEFDAGVTRTPRHVPSSFCFSFLGNLQTIPDDDKLRFHRLVDRLRVLEASHTLFESSPVSVEECVERLKSAVEPVLPRVVKTFLSGSTPGVGDPIPPVSTGPDDIVSYATSFDMLSRLLLQRGETIMASICCKCSVALWHDSVISKRYEKKIHALGYVCVIAKCVNAVCRVQSSTIERLDGILAFHLTCLVDIGDLR